MSCFTNDVERVKVAIRLAHIQQLQTFPVSEAQHRHSISVAVPSYFGFLKQWSVKAKGQISAAIAARATGGCSIDWNVSLYAFMESASMYLRDWSSVFSASVAAREGRSAEAVELLAKSDSEIQKLASMWHPDLHYITICDLVEEHPEGDPTLDGPFCGAFFSSSPNMPFIGVVFKGTHPESWEEVLVDLRYLPVQSTDGRLWNTHVSQGLFATLFGPFPKLGGQNPFDYIHKVIDMIIAGIGSVPTDVHVTGHSLGASYASLFYAESLRLQSQPSTAKLVLRDLYTFGSPRIALEDFADAFDIALLSHKGHSWRICSARDPVTLVPPVMLTDPNFTHLDKTYIVADHQEPEEVDTERGSHPKPPLPVVGMDMSHHTPWAYFDALYYTASSKTALTKHCRC